MSQGNSGTLTKPVNRKAFISSLLAKCEEALKQSSLGERFSNLIKYLGELSGAEKQPDGVLGKFLVIDNNGKRQCWFVVPGKVTNGVVSSDTFVYLSVEGISEDIRTSLCQEFGFDEFCPVTDECGCGKALLEGAHNIGDTLTGPFIKGTLVAIF